MHRLSVGQAESRFCPGSSTKMPIPLVLMGNAFATGVGTVVVLGKPAATQAA